MYEPIHGSAPDLEGKNVVNPIATTLSAAMMLNYSFNMKQAHNSIYSAVKNTLEDDYRTKDIYKDGDKLCSTTEITDIIASKIN